MRSLIALQHIDEKRRRNMMNQIQRMHFVPGGIGAEIEGIRMLLEPGLIFARGAEDHMLGCLYSSSHCNLLSFASKSATIERRQPCPRMSRRPVTTSQTSHVARPRTPTNNSGDPSAMARFPAPAKMGKLPPATPSSRCHGRVKPLA